MKKFFILLFLVFITFSMANCGGGSGSSSSPRGENPDVPFIIQLRPSQYVAQTNTFIYMHARVLNGNGNPIRDVPVTFTKLSSIGVLDQTVSNTDGSGYATVKLLSSTDGFIIVQAGVSGGSGQIRDQRTVYFTTLNLFLLPYMYLEVDGDNNGIYDEQPGDFNLFENTSDNQVIVRATVFKVTRYGQPEVGSVVTFGSDIPYRVGSSTTCSDGTGTCEVSFPLGNTPTTDIDGHASVLVQVDPLILSSVKTVLNITASADNGATDMISLFLEPVIISDVTVSANPDVVESGKTSSITAAITLNTGGPAPDNTTVGFTTTCGSIEPFAQTSKGAATATFTATSMASTCTITATAGGVMGTVDVIVTTATTMSIIPTTVNITSTAAGSADIQYFVSGGIAPYTVYFTIPVLVDAASPTTDGGTVGTAGTNQAAFTVRYSWIAGTKATFQLVVVDSLGKSANSTIILTP
jgi:hypothetical protein